MPLDLNQSTEDEQQRPPIPPSKAEPRRSPFSKNHRRSKGPGGKRSRRLKSASESNLLKLLSYEEEEQEEEGDAQSSNKSPVGRAVAWL